MLKHRLFLYAGLLLAPFGAQAQTQSQTRCEPTLSNPCRPTPAQNATPGNNMQRRDLPRLDDNKVIPDVQFDRNTTFGVGQGGGILGIERKFDPKESR
jgi:hypothetical protein